MSVNDNMNEPLGTPPGPTWPPPPPNKPRSRWLRYTVISIIVFLVVVLSAGVMFSIIYGKDIEARLVKELNKNLKTEVVINGPINFSVFSYFPNASLQIDNIVVMGSTGAKNDTLLQAGRLYLLMNIFDIINQSWNIKSIVIADGSLTMLKRADGVTNFEVLRETKEGNDSTTFLVNITEAVFDNLRVRYDDKVSQSYFDLAVEKVSLEGNFSPEKLAIKTEGTLTSRSIQIKGIEYGKDKPISLAGSFEVNPGTSSYTVKSDNIFIADNHFSLNGTLSTPKDIVTMDVRIQGIDLSINGLLKLFPEQYAKQWDDYDASGNLEFDVTVKGTLSKFQSPKVDIHYKVAKTNLKYEKLAKDIRDLSFEGSYTNGSKQNLETSQIIVKELNAYLGDKPIYVQFDLKNLADPVLKLELDGHIDLAFFNTLLPDSGTIKDMEGSVEIEKLTYTGLLSDLKPTTQSIPDIKGSFTFKDAKVMLDTTEFQIKSGSLRVSPWSVGLEDLAIKIAGTEMVLKGSITDWKGYTYNLLNAAPIPSKPMTINLTAKAEKILLENLMNLGANTSTGTSKSTLSIKEILNISGSLNVKTEVLAYNKFKAETVAGTLEFSAGKVDVKSVTMKTMGGNFVMSSVVTGNGNDFEAISTIKGTKIDVSELFRQMNDFGQAELTHENIKGTLMTTIKLHTYFTNGKLDMQRLYALADIKIENGELVDFKALKSLSKFIDMRELEDVKFSTLQNEIEVKNGVMNIPQMIIKSSALNLGFSGTHTFENIIDYRVQLNFYDILAGKIKKKKLNKDSYEVVDENSFNFFISMKGPADNPVIKYDKQGVKERFKQQGSEIKNAIRGVYDDYNTEKEKRDWDIKDEPEFLDWEEKTPK